MSRIALRRFTAFLLFIGILIGLRWFWSTQFYTLDPPQPVQDGVLDLRGFDLNNSPSLFLNGEWQFYPGKLATLEDIRKDSDQPVLVQVPGSWTAAQHHDGHNAYGYGTYRLRILVDPLEEPVSFWVQNIQASAETELNGKLVAVNGRPADKREDYEPRNISYTASYTVPGTTELELLIRVANYDQPLNGGIIRPIRFGAQSSVDFVRWYSIGFQMITFVILLLHGLYAFILYRFNRRERGLLIMALLTLLVGVAVLIGHDNVFLLWFPINYEWAAKIRIIALLWQNLLILVLFRKFAQGTSPNKVLRAFTAVLSVLSVIIAAGPISWLHLMVDLRIFLIAYSFTFVWLLYTVGTMIFRQQRDKDIIFLLLTAAGIISNLVWSVIESKYDVTTIYYPIDLTITIIGFSAYWFKKYFRNSLENAKLNEQLRETDKLKDQFLANTSHELRTPLHGIMNIAQTVVDKEREKLDKGSVRDMELLITVSRRMSFMLGDLLDVARLKEHRVVLQQEPLLIQAVVPGVIGMLEYMTQGRPIQLHSEIPAALPLVLADEKRLVQVIHNLLHNALKFTEEGDIRISAETRNGRAVIQVSDTGIGMDEETQARIFLPYEQGLHGQNDGRGIGLGLSICKQLIELHGGTIMVQSKPGKGSVFQFDLPLASEASPDGTAPHPVSFQEEIAAGFEEGDNSLYRFAPAGNIGASDSAAIELPPLSGGPIFILAVDDDPVNLNVLAGILSTESFQVTMAGSASEALELLDVRAWDLLIADVMMPQMSGYELTRKVRERYSVSDLPILLLTARSQPADVYTGFLAGANDYVTKPVDAIELKYRIRALIMLKQSINESLRMEAAYLQAQIHPHFLFNTLNSLIALSDFDTNKMRSLGEAFVSYLRISFNFLNTGELVDLSHELELVESYLYIEKERFEERLIVEWEVEPGISLQLPPLSIQPLVENAVKHGLFRRRTGGKLRLRIARRDHYTLVEVQDNGVGMDEETAQLLLTLSPKGSRGVGLSNTNRRLNQLYGQGLSIVSKPNEGTTVSFRIPDQR
ncbi:ATP-binding protein [Paenibacillus sp. NPDC058071]|uniref:hybrid sensor histidine kinase/response regulator n=1 Tax=Paenibacillus sp. NPDC058071 TaxID=3346326 RepID=UPI0036D90CEA